MTDVFQKFEEKIKQDPLIKQGVDDGKWDFVLDYINQNMIDKPEGFYPGKTAPFFAT